MGKTKPPYAEVISFLVAAHPELIAFKQQIVELSMAARTPAELSREDGVAAQSELD